MSGPAVRRMVLDERADAVLELDLKKTDSALSQAVAAAKALLAGQKGEYK